MCLFLRGMARWLAIRFSAPGDVVMTLPVLWSVARRYADDEIVLLSRGWVEPLMGWMPGNVVLRAVDLDAYRGVWGLWRLARELRREGYDGVADLHGVLRSRVLGVFFRLWGVPVETIDKGRRSRRLLVSGRRRVALASQEERFGAVFGLLGRPAELSFVSLFEGESRRVAGGGLRVGVAPFARHAGKVYPLEAMERVVEGLSERGARVWLFGCGERERSVCESWESKYAGVVSTVGRLGGLGAEVELMAGLDVILTMDSANMHLAAVAGTRTVTVWGATHRLAGFAGWRQAGSRDVEMELDCRPCSIFGSKKCRNAVEMACMRGIAAERIVEVVVATAEE